MTGRIGTYYHEFVLVRPVKPEKVAADNVTWQEEYERLAENRSESRSVSRLRTLVDDIKSLPMDQQGKQVSDYFTEWQGKNEQVDDVLFMGIRI